jgi:hypothetical protein
MGAPTKSILKSSTFWWQLITVLGMLVTSYSQLGLINASIAGFLSFSISVVIQKFFSKGPGSIADNMTFTVLNVVGALAMIIDYFLSNQLFTFFGSNSVIVGITVATINTFIRMYVLNQPPPTEDETP